MSWLYSRALVAEYGAANCLGGARYAPSSVSPTPQAYLHSDKTTEFSRLSRFGMTFGLLTESRGAELLMLFLVASHAKTYLSGATEPGSGVKEADFGNKWLGSFPKLNHAMSGWKILPCSSQGGLPQSSRTLPQWGLMLGGELWGPTTLERYTNEKEYGLLDSTPTKVMPVERELMPNRIRILPSGRPRKLNKTGISGSLNWAQLMLHKGLIPTPELCEYYMGWPIGATALRPLETGKFQQWQRAHGIF